MNPIELINDPFFIFYETRSGSTFLANLLIKKVNASIPPESKFITHILSLYPSDVINDLNDLETIIQLIFKENKFSDWNISRDYIRAYFKSRIPIKLRLFILALCAIFQKNNFPDARLFGVKKGSYIQHYEKIKNFFPNSKYIGIVRDGRAVFNSLKKSLKSSTGMPFEENPIRAAIEWLNISTLLKNIQKKEKNLLIIYYEDLVHFPRKTIEFISKFLNVPINQHNSIKEKKYIVPQRYGKLHENINKKPLINRISAWKNELSYTEILAYELISHSVLVDWRYKLIFPIKYLKNPVNHIKFYLQPRKLWFNKWFLIRIYQILKEKFSRF